MRRTWPLLVIGLAFAVSTPAIAQPPRTLVLPFRTLGVGDTTAVVFRSLLASELETHGVVVVPDSRTPEGPTSAACSEIDCAKELAAAADADRVVFGALSRLGEKIIVRVRVLERTAPEPTYSDQLTALREDDLDVVARRIAEGISAGKPNATQATIQSVTMQETLEPRRRASRQGVGFRTGFLFPVAQSYGGAHHLTTLRLAFRYETNDLFVETTPVLGFAWGDGNFEWTFLDMNVGRQFGKGDWSPFVVGGVGVHSVRVAVRYPYTYSDPYSSYTYTSTYEREQFVTAMTADVGVGMMALRTFDFSIYAELRYHVVFSQFDELGSKGAHGVALSFGTSR